MKEPKISIIIPIYNAEKYLNQCLNSILKQTLMDWECLLIDDGSTDASGSISEKYAQHDSRFRLFYKENGGVSSARNMGLDYAKGKWIFFVDADDFLDYNIIEKLVEAQIKSGADIVSSGFYIYRDHKDTPVHSPVEYSKRHEMLKHLSSQGLHHELFCRIIRRELFTKHNIAFTENINIGEDWLLLVKLTYYANKVARIDDIGYHYNCENINSAMATIRTKYLQKQIEDLRVLLEISRFFVEVSYKPVDDFSRYFARKLYDAKWESIKMNSKADYMNLCNIQRNITPKTLDVDLDTRTLFHAFLSGSFTAARLLLFIKQIFA